MLLHVLFDNLCTVPWVMPVHGYVERKHLIRAGNIVLAKNFPGLNDSHFESIILIDETKCIKWRTIFSVNSRASWRFSTLR